MTPTKPAENRLAEAVSLRQEGRNEDARHLLLELYAAIPEDAALALYNAGDAKEACQILVRILAESSVDPDVSSYRQALLVYAENLDQTW